MYFQINMWSRRSAIERCPSVEPKTIMSNSNSLQAGEGQCYFVKTNPMLWKTKLHKYHCPSLACKLLLLGIIVFGFTAKGIARSQIDDSTCFIKILVWKGAKIQTPIVTVMKILHLYYILKISLPEVWTIQEISTWNQSTA